MDVTYDSQDFSSNLINLGLKNLKQENPDLAVLDFKFF